MMSVASTLRVGAMVLPSLNMQLNLNLPRFGGASISV